VIFPDRKFVAELTHDIPSIFKVTSGDGDICVSGDGSDFRMDVVNIGRVIVKEQNSIVGPFSVVQTDFDWNFSVELITVATLRERSPNLQNVSL